VRRRFIIRSPPSRPCFPDSPRHVSWKLWLGGQSSFDAQDPRESIGAVPSAVEGPKVLGKTTKTSDRPRRQSPSLVRGHAVVRPLRTIVSAGHGAESLGNKPKKMSPLSKRMPIYNQIIVSPVGLRRQHSENPHFSGLLVSEDALLRLRLSKNFGALPFLILLCHLAGRLRGFL
jgi:hypothetical protein